MTRTLDQILLEGFGKWGNSYVDSLLKDFVRPDQAHPQTRARLSRMNPELRPASREHLQETAQALSNSGHHELAQQVWHHSQQAMPSSNIAKLWGQPDIDPADAQVDQAAQGINSGYAGGGEVHYEKVKHT